MSQVPSGTPKPSQPAQGTDWDFTDELVDIAKDLLADSIEGGKQDIHDFVTSMVRTSKDALLLEPAARARVLKNNRANLPALAELNRVRAVNNGWDKVGRVLALIESTLSRYAAIALKMPLA